MSRDWTRRTGPRGVQRTTWGRGIAVAFIFIFTMMATAATQSGGDVIWFTPTPAGAVPGVAFEQVSFDFAGTTEMFSTWGRLTVTPRQVVASTRLTSGYINVVTELGWVVWNLPFSEGDSSDEIPCYFAISAQGGVAVQQLRAGVIATATPVPSVEADAVPLVAARGVTYPVGRAIWRAEGAGSWRAGAIAPAPALGGLLAKIAQGLPPVNTQYTQPGPVNILAAKSQCFPMAVANSLEYLKNRYGISIPHVHRPGRAGDNTLVGKLDSYAKRTDDDGVWFQQMLDAKFEYLKDNGLAGSLVHHHQGRGWGSVAAGEALPAGDFTRHGITSTDDGAVVTFEWLCAQIQKGADVELVFSFDDSDGVPIRGHVVRVFECGKTLGIPWIGYLHDRLQGNDPAGLETPRVELVDLDGDGLLNLGAPGEEIRFAMSESTSEAPRCEARIWSDRVTYQSGDAIKICYDLGATGADAVDIYDFLPMAPWRWQSICQSGIALSPGIHCGEAAVTGAGVEALVLRVRQGSCSATDAYRFAVGGDQTLVNRVSVSTDKKVYLPGEAVTVAYEIKATPVSAWIYAVTPSGVGCLGTSACGFVPARSGRIKGDQLVGAVPGERTVVLVVQTVEYGTVMATCEYAVR